MEDRCAEGEKDRTLELSTGETAGERGDRQINVLRKEGRRD